ncbi:MarR family transcriptional regulator [Sphingobium sp. YR657]|uniref:MarR family transcriptional regulator n=1 Tax=Sphingobium sp. YR657 TaxID=1884366 RepID=UPI003137AE74
MPHQVVARMDTCRKLVTMRKALGDTLGYRYCASPVWDMLLELYIAAREKRTVYLWSLCSFANVPYPTACRKVYEMEKIGLVLCNATDRERRGIRVSLTEKGQGVVESLLDRLAEIYKTNIGTRADISELSAWTSAPKMPID